jgi:hypothetical protein
VIVEADAPRIEQQASKVSGVIDVKMCEEDGLEAPEVETSIHKGRRATSTAVDDEYPIVDHERG